jgi:hypothetical protein
VSAGESRKAETVNRISFKGMTEVLVDFAERFLVIDPIIIQPADGVRERFGRLIEAIDLPEDLELRHLENVVDFLYEHGVSNAEIEELLSSDSGRVIDLANDVAILEKHLEKGMIIDVRVIDAG